MENNNIIFGQVLQNISRYELYEKLFYNVLNKSSKFTSKHKFKNPLYSMDTTTFDLCLSLYNWTKFKKTKGGIKLHLKLNLSGYIPSFAIITEADVHEINAAKQIPYLQGDDVVFDRGFNDYVLFF